MHYLKNLSSGGCTYKGEAGENGTASPNKLEFENGENITIICTHGNRTNNCSKENVLEDDAILKSNLTVIGNDTITSTTCESERLTMEHKHVCTEGLFLPKIEKCFSDSGTEDIAILGSGSKLTVELFGLVMILILIG